MRGDSQFRSGKPPHLPCERMHGDEAAIRLGVAILATRAALTNARRQLLPLCKPSSVSRQVRSALWYARRWLEWFGHPSCIASMAS